MLNQRSDKVELLRIAESVAAEKSIDTEIILTSMETAIQKAAKTKFGSENDIRAKIDRESGDITLHKVLTVVEKPENLDTEISLKEAKKIENICWLAQGTIYPDVIESAGADTGKAKVIKSHHNVAGIPDTLELQLLEPLLELFKDEVRELGRELGLPEHFVERHPFPGPGLAIRIPGEITPEKLNTLREVDAIYLEEIRGAGLYNEIWQAFAILLPVQTVGVMGDRRTYDYVCSLRAVTSTDGMTADFFPFDMEFLGRTANRIINEVRGINRVVYDITSKPPGTIEWE